MRKTLFFALTAAALAIAPTLAEAGALTQLSVPGAGNNVTLVEGGCGPGGFRAGNGACYRRPPPRGYYRRACPPGYHLSPRGCRPNF